MALKATNDSAGSAHLRLEAGGLAFAFLNGGDLYEASHGPIMINQLRGNPIDGSLNNLYLRLHGRKGIEAYPLLGVRSGSRFSRSENALVWEGTAGGVHYAVVFRLTDRGIWFWDVRLNGRGGEADVLYGQDIAIADRGAVLSNEAYVSQYIGHRVFRGEAKGYVICSRQNQPQSGKFPYLQQGALTGAAAYATDGFQFFGLSYKETNEPEALRAASLPSEVYQYEFAYAALQSERVRLDGGEARIVFYGLFKDDHAEAVSALEYEDEVASVWRDIAPLPVPETAAEAPVKPAAAIGEPLRTLPLDAETIDRLYPERVQEEWDADGKTLLSFFTPTHEHVVLKEKELLVERPHGHILMSGGNDRVGGSVLSTTAYMYGIFNAQVTVGNTTFNKWISNPRSALNAMKTSGQRIYVETDGRYRLLTMPSAFEMGFNYARWRYRTERDTIVVTGYTALEAPELRLQVESEQGVPYRYLVTQQVTMNGNEYEAPFGMERQGDTLAFRPASPSLTAAVCPGLTFRLRLDGAEWTVTDETKLADGPVAGGASLVVLELGASASWRLTVQGLEDGRELPFAERPFEAEKLKYRAHFANVMNGFRLAIPGSGGDDACDPRVGKVNTLAWWYTHNMLVHFAVPHGLEQYGGAAWGTRDVSQGPVEYFLAMRKYDVVRDILLTLFSHQYEDDGSWPQWFMFDGYYKIQGSESHGDVIVWPLKVLGDYLKATKDYAILEEALPYMDRSRFEFTADKEPLLAHAVKEIGYIRSHFLHGTHLSAYGDGDWDDTLQPANAQLKKYMVSSWTVALTYQTVRNLSEALADCKPDLSDELRRMAEGIGKDFGAYMLETGVIPGFLYMEEPGKAEPMVHPSDTKTGIQYRLLPMTRSMIAELVGKEQAEANYRLIKEQFYCPDGVRLMNRPANYNGGVSRHFKRAEQASNFGREIGLQYVHAHIRFVEAMAKMGYRDEAWKGLLMINPVGLREVVPNAELRQSNAYFSSSDGKFKDRYEAAERYEELRSGSVPVKGGWRIYSSGPGIYMNQLISNCLGIRSEAGDLIVDPVLPAELDGLLFEFRLMDRPVTFRYRLGGETVERISVNGREADGVRMPNRYRDGGLRIGKAFLEEALRAEGNVIDIVMG